MQVAFDGFYQAGEHGSMTAICAKTFPAFQS